MQVLDETVAPKLGGADVVIADRFLYTAEVLARHGRGLPADALRPILESVAGGARSGMQPDLVVLFDVDPSVARGRRKISKTISPDRRQPSRKGLAGSGLQQRLREGYLQLAARDPDRWMAIDNSDGDLDTVTNRVVALVMAAYQRGARAAIAEMRRAELPAVGAHPPRLLITPKQALAAFLDWVDHRALTEPQMAAYVLAGLCGAGIDERRLALAAAAPTVLARGLRGMSDAVSWQLRRSWRAPAPQEVAFSLEEDAAEADEAWRAAPRAPARPRPGGRDQPAGAGRRGGLAAARAARAADPRRRHDLRWRSSTGTRAWRMRERWLDLRGGSGGPVAAHLEGARIACRAVTGLDDARAWEIRGIALDSAPVAAHRLARGAEERARVDLARAPPRPRAQGGAVDHRRPRRSARLEPCARRRRTAAARRSTRSSGSTTRSRGRCARRASTSGRRRRSRAWARWSAIRAAASSCRARWCGHPDSISLLKQAATVATGGHLHPNVLAA